MTKAEIIEAQKVERGVLLKTILESKASKKIIVAGAGTGKTYTFSEVLKLNPKGANIAMTFIRLLRNDMEGMSNHSPANASQGCIYFPPYLGRSPSLV